MNITNIRFGEIDTPDYNTRLNDITVIMTVVDGVAPFRVSQNNTGLVKSNQTGPDVEIDIPRTSFPRDITVIDATLASVSFEADTLQPINEDADYEPYTFIVNSSGVATGTLTQSLKNTTVYGQYANRLIRVVDPETSYSLSDWISITIDGTFDYLGLPLRYVNIEIKDEYNANYKLDRAIELPAPNDAITIIQDIAPISFISDQQDITVSGKANYIDSFKLTYDGLTVETYPDMYSGFGVFTLNDLIPQFNVYYTKYEDRDLFHNPKHDIITNSVDQISSGIYSVSDTFGTIESDTKYFIAGATEYGEVFNINDYTCNPLSSNPSDQKFLSKWFGRYQLKTTDYAVNKFLNGDFILQGTGTPLINNNYIAFVRYEYNEAERVWVDDDTWYEDETRTNFITLIDNGMDVYSNQKQSIPYGIQNFQDAITAGGVTDLGGSDVSTNFLLDDDTSFYEVFLVKNSGGVVTKGSQSMFININKECSRFGNTQFFFEDSYGCYNTFSFDNINVKDYGIKRSTSASNINTLNRTTGFYGYSVGDRGRKTNAVKKTEEHSVTSGWLDDNLSKSLIDLYTSADVYVIIDGKRFPILITSKSVESKTTKNNRLFNHTISYEMAYDINTNV